MTFPSFLEADPGDTRQRILAEGVKLFSQLGYARTTTRALAAAAGVTEVTLFRYFESKEKLFEASVQQFGGPVVASLFEEQMSGEDFRADLTRIGNIFMKIMQQRSELIRLALCEVVHFPELRDTMAQNPRALMAVITRYFDQQIKKNHIRPVNPEAAAQAFLGALFSYGLMTVMFADPEKSKLTPEQVVETTVGIFVEGTSLQE